MYSYEYETGSQKIDRQIKELTKTLIAFVIVSAIAVICHYLVFSIVYIPTESMYPTLQAKDKVIMNRIYIKIKRGDIITFKNPETNKDQIYLTKRIIGIPGDTIEIKNNILYINGKEYKENYTHGSMTTQDFKIVVSKENYFVMGDNRNYSRDSRHWTIQCIPENEIVGKVKNIISPLSRIKRIK